MINNNITIIENNALQGSKLHYDYIHSWVQWLDRSEATTKTHTNNLKQFVAYCRYNNITAPTRDTVISFRDWLQTEHEAIQLDNDSVTGWSYRTRNGKLVSLKATVSTTANYLRSVAEFFQWTEAEGIYPNITMRVRIPKTNNSHKRESLTPAQVKTIGDSITATADSRTLEATGSDKDARGKAERSSIQGLRLKAMFELATCCGLRVIELHRANIKDFVEIDGQAFIYIYGKGHQEADQKKAVPTGTAKAIKDYLKARTDSYNQSSPLFVATGNRSDGQRLAKTTISKMLKKAMVEAGFNSESLTAHSLRHSTAGAVMEVSQGDLYTTQKYLRHQSPVTTEIYLNDNNEATTGVKTAEQVYNLLHNVQDTGNNDLQSIIAGMTTDQLKQLTDIARALA